MTNDIEHFLLLICLLYVFVDEVSVQSYAHSISECLFIFTEFKSSLYILDTSVLSEKCFPNMELVFQWIQR